MTVKTVKMCDMNIEVAVLVLRALNYGKVDVIEPSLYNPNIKVVTNFEPKDLVYPEGWYYSNGYFTNRRMSTTGFCSAALVVNSKGELWKNKVTYFTFD